MPKRDLVKEKVWREKLENFKNSGLSQSEWCKRNNEKMHCFKYWLQRLKIDEMPKIAFEELTDSPQQYTIEIHRKELSISLPNGFDQKTLKECLLAIEKVSC